jgi:hypothetical protein
MNDAGGRALIPILTVLGIALATALVPTTTGAMEPPALVRMTAQHAIQAPRSGAVLIAQAETSTIQPARAPAEKAEAVAQPQAAPAPVTIGRGTRVWTVVLATAILLLATLLLTGGQLASLIVGQDNRYSNSKFQMALWFAVLIVAYLSATILRWWTGGAGYLGDIAIPKYLLALSGASALTYGAAKGITNNKQAAALASGQPGKVPAAKPSFPSDLVHNDYNQPDLGDFQMIIITLLVVAVYLAQLFHFLGTLAPLHQWISLPDVDPALLAVFGLGQGAYLTKKYAGNAGES